MTNLEHQKPPTQPPRKITKTIIAQMYGRTWRSLEMMFMYLFLNFEAVEDVSYILKKLQ